MADRRPILGRHFERATAARGSVARGKRPHASLRTAARVLSAATKIKSRRCVVACESSDLRASRRIRLDHESGGFRIDFDLRNKNGDLASFYEIPDTGHTFQHYLSLADAFKGKKAHFDPNMIGLLADWLQNKAITHED